MVFGAEFMNPKWILSNKLFLLQTQNIKNMKKSFIIHVDSLDILDHLTDEQSGQLFRAIRDFHNGIQPELDFGLKMAFLPFQNQFKRDLDKYITKCETNRLNGRNGGRPKKSETEKTESVFDKPNKTERMPKNHDSDNENENGNDNENETIQIPLEFVGLLEWFNQCFQKRSRVFPKSIIAKYKKLFRDGFTMDDVKNAMTNAKRDQFHMDSKFKHCTLEFFSRPDKIDRFANQSEQSNITKKYIPTL